MVYQKAAVEGVLAAGRVNTDSGDGMKMTENPTMNDDASEKIGSMAAGRVNTDSGDGMKMTENPTMNDASEKIGSMAAGRVNTDSGDEMKMTENPTMNDASEKIGTGFDSRDRRKSKYLSYPYTNVGPRNKGLPAETEDLRTETSSTMKNASNKTPSVAKLGSKRCHSHKAETSSITLNALNRTPSYAKLSNKRFRRNWQRKFISSSAVPSSTEFINASPAELLSGLQLKAVDCMLPMEDKSFDLAEWFFCKYRVSKYHDEAELATSMVNVNGENMGERAKDDLQDTKTEKGGKYNKRENTGRRKMKSLSGLSDVNISSSTSDLLRPVGKLKRKREVENETPLQQPQNVEVTLNESNGKYSSVPKLSQNSTSGSLRPEEKGKQKSQVEEEPTLQQAQNVEITLNASNGKHSSVPEVSQDSASGSLRPGGKLKQKQTVEVTPLQLPQNVEPQNVEITLNGTNGKYGLGPEAPQITKCSTLVIDLQVIPPSMPDPTLQKCNGENKGEPVRANLNPESCVSSLERLVRNSLGTTSMAATVLSYEAGLIGKMEKVTEGQQNNKLAAEIPDLNCTVSEPNSITREYENVDMLLPDVKLEQPNLIERACLFLQFAPGVLLPSKEDLMATFIRFGPVNAYETKLLQETFSAQIVFVRSADARLAFHSLDQSKPFGAALVDYKLILHHLPAAGPPVQQQRLMTPTQLPTMSMSTPMADVANPPLHVMKQELERMASMLENPAINISPEIRAKLDHEVKTLLKKVKATLESSLQNSERR